MPPSSGREHLSSSPPMLDAELYLRVREMEGRIYQDELAANLPEVPPNHPLRREWFSRSASLKRLLAYIARLPRPPRLLELGCGNGWLSNRIASLPGVQVWGLDRAGLELSQAARLFSGANLMFLAADVFQPPFPHSTFDLVLVASVIQYFPDLSALVRSLRGLLRSAGEVHIMDSPLYEEDDLPSARERTQAYYAALGFADMGKQYFHHSFEEVEKFSPTWHYRPDSMSARLARGLGHIDSPFPWLSIR
jgi:SAM-dependent methyltransferase